MKKIHFQAFQRYPKLRSVYCQVIQHGGYTTVGALGVLIELSSSRVALRTYFFSTVVKQNDGEKTFVFFSTETKDNKEKKSIVFQQRFANNTQEKQFRKNFL